MITMNIAIITLIINTQEMLTMRMLASPSLCGSFYFFDNNSFLKKQTNYTTKTKLKKYWPTLLSMPNNC